MTLTKFIAGALLLAGATTANAVTFAQYRGVPAAPTNMFLTSSVLSAQDPLGADGWSPILFSYTIPELTPLGELAAKLTFTANETVAVPGLKGTVQAAYDGSFEIRYTGSTTIIGGIIIKNNDLLLGGTFTDAVLSGRAGGGSVSGSNVFDSMITNDVVYSSFFLDFDPLDEQAFGVGLSAITPGLAIVGPALSKHLRDFSASSVATYSATITDVHYHTDVPEPASWAMMVAGFGLLGGAMRRARRTTLTVVTA